jgi:K+-sensing histidine kinase KdpD
MVGASSKSHLEITQMPPADPLPSPANSPVVVGYLAALVMTAAATVLAVSVDLGVTIPNLSLIFVVPVVIAGASFGLGPSLCAAILGALAYNFFLTEPRYSLAVSDPANVWAIALLFVVGLVVSSVAFTSGRRATDAASLRRQMTVLQGFSRDIVAADKPEAIVSLTSEALAGVFEVPAVVMLVTDDAVSVKQIVGAVELQDAEIGAALSSLAAQTAVRAGIYPAVTSRFDFWPVVTARGQSAVIGLAFDPAERPSKPEMLVDIVRGVLELALDRQLSPAGGNARSAG